MRVALEVMSPVHCTDVLGTVPCTYRIVSRGTAAYLAGFSLVWFGLIVGFVIIGQLAHYGTAALVGGGLAALLIALVPALLTALLPYDVTLSDEGICEFRSVMRRRSYVTRPPQHSQIGADEGPSLDAGASYGLLRWVVGLTRQRVARIIAS